MTDALHRSTQLAHDLAGDTRCEPTLRTVLRANALNSAVFGVVMTTAPSVVDNVLGTGQPGWIRVVGLALFPFAGFCVWLSLQQRRALQVLTPGVVLSDAGWVAASVVTVLMGWYSASGIVAVAAMALAVDLFAVLQFRAWRAIRN